VNFPQLEMISLDNNLIKYMNPEGFLRLPKLFTFYMCCNKLEQLERGSFPFLQKRKATIPLRNNSINKVDVNVFDKMTATDVTVGFFNNLISVLPNGILDGHTYENVNLRFSKIIDFRIFVS
jgi:hypothetical protein